MIEGHIFVDAYFTNDERTVCESLWYSAEENVYRTYVVIAEEGDVEWEKFLKHPIDETGRTVTLEDLYERTYIRLQEQRQEIKDALKSIADEDEFAEFRIALEGKISDLKEELKDTEVKFSKATESLKKETMINLLDMVFNLDKNKSTEDENKEQLFLLKLAVFEWGSLKDVDATFKKNVRKSKSAAEVLELISNYLK